VNLASYLDSIHYYSANRLVKVFELVTKKYTLVVSSLARKDTPSESPSVYQGSSSPSPSPSLCPCSLLPLPSILVLRPSFFVKKDSHVSFLPSFLFLFRMRSLYSPSNQFMSLSWSPSESTTCLRSSSSKDSLRNFSMSPSFSPPPIKHSGSTSSFLSSPFFFHSFLLDLSTLLGVRIL
jgi:hypothetical protein